MREEQCSLVLEWYNDLEERFLDFLKYIPLRKENFDVISPKLVSITVEACLVLDSLFRHFSSKYNVGKVSNKKESKLKITDYQMIYSKKLNLPTFKTLVMMTPAFYLTPFAPWGNTTIPNRKLSWWGIYNKLKHDRIANEQCCTLNVALETLCGLHQSICRLPELCRGIVRHRWIEVEDYNIEALIEIVEGDSRDETFLGVTKLFASPIGSKPFPDKIEQLQPMYYRGNRRLSSFLGRM